MLDFRKFLLEAVFDPSLANLYRWKFNDKSYLGRNVGLKIDSKGNIIKSNEGSYFSLEPQAKIINLQRISPQSPDFKKIINAIKPKYPDIDTWEVQVYMMAMHQLTGNEKHYRTVDYWLNKGVNINNKLPKFVYHGTDTNTWYLSIKKEGLLPRKLSGSMGGYGSQNIKSLSRSDMVYLSTDPDAATREAAFQSARKYGGKPLIIKIDTTGLDINKFHPDEDSDEDSAQKSINKMSTFAYSGKIPPMLLIPYLLGESRSKWVYFHNVPIHEHPLTKQLKDGRLPYRGEAEYYALKDAGIIDTTEYRTDSGHRQEKQVLLRTPDDTEVRSVLKKSANWSQNVKAINNDMSSGYSGTLYQLNNLSVENLTDEDKILLQPLLESKLLEVDKGYLSLKTWFTEKYVISFAKLLGKMDFREYMVKINKMLEELPK